jgi:hypothetical protein
VDGRRDLFDVGVVEAVGNEAVHRTDRLVSVIALGAPKVEVSRRAAATSASEYSRRTRPKTGRSPSQ